MQVSHITSAHCSTCRMQATSEHLTFKHLKQPRVASNLEKLNKQTKACTSHTVIKQPYTTPMPR